MSAELSMIDGQAEFAYLETEGTAWHGEGQAVPAIEAHNLDNWLKASNMGNWTIDKHPVLNLLDGVLYEVPNRVTLRRSDNKAPLSIVSGDFQIVQPSEVVRFFDKIIKELGFQMSTCGVLFDGKRYWAQANTPHNFEVNGDTVLSKLLLATGNDGIATTASWTNVRTVCNNTWQAAMASSQGKVKFTHRQEFNAEDLQAELGIPDVEGLKAATTAMSQKRMTEDAAYDYFARVFDIKIDEDEDMSELERSEATLALAQQSSNAKNCFKLFNGAGIGAEMVTAKSTLWGAFNAVTEYADHGRNTRTWDSRFDSAQFGAWKNIKSRAWDEALILAA